MFTSVFSSWKAATKSVFLSTAAIKKNTQKKPCSSIPSYAIDSTVDVQLYILEISFVISSGRL